MTLTAIRTYFWKRVVVDKLWNRVYNVVKGIAYDDRIR